MYGYVNSDFFITSAESNIGEWNSGPALRPIQLPTADAAMLMGHVLDPAGVCVSQRLSQGREHFPTPFPTWGELN